MTNETRTKPWRLVQRSTACTPPTPNTKGTHANPFWVIQGYNNDHPSQAAPPPFAPKQSDEKDSEEVSLGLSLGPPPYPVVHRLCPPHGKTAARAKQKLEYKPLSSQFHSKWSSCRLYGHVREYIPQFTQCTAAFSVRTAEPKAHNTPCLLAC